MGRPIVGSENDAAELMAEVDREIRQQATEEEDNVFISVKEMREFVKTELPRDNVFFSVIMCALAAERLANNRGTRVTFIDGFMQPHFKPYSRKLEQMDIFRKEARVFKVTVWDPKQRTLGKPRFRVGSVYEVKKIHGVKFYHDVLQGNMQAVGLVNPGLIEEYGLFESAKRARLEKDDQIHGNPSAGDEEEKKEGSADENEYDEML